MLFLWSKQELIDKQTRFWVMGHGCTLRVGNESQPPELRAVRRVAQRAAKRHRRSDGRVPLAAQAAPLQVASGVDADHPAGRDDEHGEPVAAPGK